MDGISPITWAMLAALALAAAAFVRVFNRLVGARNACLNAGSSIEVNLKKRHDLVPNLVRVVRGYAEHEREVLHLVTEARRRAVARNGSGLREGVRDLLPRHRLPGRLPQALP